MRTFSDIIRDAGGPTALARTLGEDPNNAHAWKRCDSIPATRWAAISKANIASLDVLAAAAAEKLKAA
ncbi:hypothetical protein OB03_13065 [Brevundimonas sp. GN22]